MRNRAHYDQELDALTQLLAVLGNDVAAAVEASVHGFTSQNTTAAQSIIANDGEIDRQQDVIEQRVMEIIALQQPVAGDLRRLLSAMDVAAELERIGDYAKRISKATIRQPKQPAQAPEVGIAKLGELASSMLRTGLQAYVQRDMSGLDAIKEQDDAVDAMEDEIRFQMLEFIKRDPQSAEWALDQTLVAHTLERVGDRVTNMAEQLVFAIRAERVDLN